MAGLRSVLAGEPLPPPDRGIARHEELVHEFGLDRPEVTESDGGWTVRVERQLTCPAEVAWDLWFGKDRDTGEQRAAPAVGEPLTPYMAPEVVIGTMTEVELHRVLAFDVAPTGGPGEHVRVEFADGTGHGVRVTLTVTGTDPPNATPPPRCGAPAPSGTSPHRLPSGLLRSQHQHDVVVDADADDGRCPRLLAAGVDAVERRLECLRPEREEAVLVGPDLVEVQVVVAGVERTLHGLDVLLHVGAAGVDFGGVCPR